MFCGPYEGGGSQICVFWPHQNRNNRCHWMGPQSWSLQWISVWLLPAGTYRPMQLLLRRSPQYENYKQFHRERDTFHALLCCCFIAKSCPTLLGPHGLPGSSVRGISQARILEWVAGSFSRGSSKPGIRPASPDSPALAGKFLTTEPLGKPFICLALLKTFSQLCNCGVIFAAWLL